MIRLACWFGLHDFSWVTIWGGTLHDLRLRCRHCGRDADPANPRLAEGTVEWKRADDLREKVLVV